MERHCTKCEEHKDISEFGRLAAGPGGLNHYCRKCVAATARQYRERHPEAASAAQKRWLAKNPGYQRERNAAFYAENQESQRARTAAYRDANPDKVAASTKAWREANKERFAEMNRDWHIANRDRRRAYRRAQYVENRERENALSKDWKAANHEKCVQHTMKRAAAKKQAIPSWADKDHTDAFYMLADLLTEETGVRHHVDHIVPLQSKLVCGLHWHGNLQVIPAVENHRKKNVVWPDMPERKVA